MLGHPGLEATKSVRVGRKALLQLANCGRPSSFDTMLSDMLCNLACPKHRDRRPVVPPPDLLLPFLLLILLSIRSLPIPLSAILSHRHFKAVSRETHTHGLVFPLQTAFCPLNASAVTFCFSRFRARLGRLVSDYRFVCVYVGVAQNRGVSIFRSACDTSCLVTSS